MDVLPPLLPDLASQLESYLLHPQLLPIHDTGPAQQFWPRRPDPLALLPAPLGPSAPLDTQLRVVRDPCTGRVTGFEEVALSAAEAGTTAKNSTSLRRAPGPLDESTRGSATNYPFWPGGFDAVSVAEVEAASGAGGGDQLDFSPAALLHCPPGFEAGIDFFKLGQAEERAGVKDEPEVDQLEELAGKKVVVVEDVLNLASLLYQDSDILESWREAEEKEGGGKAAKKKAAVTANLAGEADSLLLLTENGGKY